MSLALYKDSSGTPAPTDTESNVSTRVRTDHVSRDAALIDRLSMAQEITTAEERMQLQVVDIRVKLAVTSLLKAVHKRDPDLCKLSQAVKASQEEFDRNAIEHYIARLKESTEKLRDILRKQTDQARLSLNGKSDLVEAARAHWDAIKAEHPLDDALTKQFNLHPYDVIRMAINAANVNAVKVKRRLKTPLARPNLVDLKKYIRDYNAKKGTALTLQETLSEFFEDVAEYAAFLSRADLDQKNRSIIRPMRENLLSDWLLNEKTITAAAEMLMIPIHGDVLGHQNVDNLVRYMAELAKKHLDREYRLNMIKDLTQMFRNGQVAMMIRKLSAWHSPAYKPLRYHLFLHLEDQKVSPEDLRLEFAEAGTVTTAFTNVSRGIVKRYTTFHGKRKP